MAGETVITVVGNLTADPELRFTQNGPAVANFTVASTPRTFDRRSGEFKAGEPLFLRCSCWREFAENVAGSLSKGTRVVVQGRLRARTYETKEGERRTSYELDVDEIGPSLRYATATVTRNERSGNFAGGQGGNSGYGQGNSQQGGGWGQAPAGNYGGGQGGQGGNSGYGQGGHQNQAPGGYNDDPWASSNPQNQGGWGNSSSEDPPF